MLKANRTGRDQRGFASLVIGLILVLVLALLTVGFAELTRHEQQQSLANLLGSQAYYAAESGINDAVKDIDNGSIYPGYAGVDSGNCMGSLPGISTNVVNAANGTLYSCVLISLQTKDLQYKPVNAGQGQSAVFATDAPLTSLTVNWGTNDGNNDYRDTYFPAKLPTTTYKVNATQTYPPLIQFSITSLANVTRSAMTNSTFTVFDYPSNTASGTVGYSTAMIDQGQLESGHCAGAGQYPCSVKITGLAAMGGPYLIHFLDFYDPAQVDITGTTATGAATFTGGQAEVDVTGKAQNVLKRLQVRVPLNAASNFADYALQAKNICKLMQSAPQDAGPTGVNPSGTTFLDPTGATAAGDPCKLDVVN